MPIPVGRRKARQPVETARCEERALSQSRTHTRSAAALSPVFSGDTDGGLTGRARLTEAAGAARVTSGCASAPGPGPGAEGRDPQRGLPGIHGGRRRKTLRREGSGFTRSEGD